MTVTALDKIPPYEDVSTISTPFPEEKYKKLLNLCNLTEDSKLGDHQKSQIFVNAIYHFLKGHLSQDELSSIASSFWVPGEIDANSELGELYMPHRK